MSVHSGMLRLQTAGHGEIVDVTEGVRAVLRTSGVTLGVLTVFARGSTVAITTMEYEPGGVRDLQELLEALIPAVPANRGEYAHNRLNHDSNAHAHLRASLIGPSQSIPVTGGELVLGTWQQVVLIDFDVRPRERTITVHVVD